MALEELRGAVLASRYLLGGSVVNDSAARSWFSQVDFDGSGAYSLSVTPASRAVDSSADATRQAYPPSIS